MVRFDESSGRHCVDRPCVRRARIDAEPSRVVTLVRGPCDRPNISVMSRMQTSLNRWYGTVQGGLEGRAACSPRTVGGKMKRIPDRVVGRLCLALVVVGLGRDWTIGVATGHSAFSISTTPAMQPAFSRQIRDYAIRCTGSPTTVLTTTGHDAVTIAGSAVAGPAAGQPPPRCRPGSPGRERFQDVLPALPTQ